MAEPFVGEIRLFGGNFAPVGWFLCNGALLSIAEYEVLYTLLGTAYGGDGVTTFALPDLRGRAPLHVCPMPVTGRTSYELGEHGGAETVTLTSNQIPSHRHVLTASSDAASLSSPAAAVTGNAATRMYRAPNITGAMSPSTIAVTGGNLPHENMQPFVAVNYIIAFFGIYPSQS